MLRLNLEVLAVLLGTLVPLAVGLLTHWSASSSVKALLNVTLSAIAVFCTLAINNDGLLSKQTVITFALAFLASGVSHTNLWKPTGVTDFLQYRIPVGVLKDHDTIDRVNAIWGDVENFRNAIEAQKTVGQPALGASRTGSPPLK